MSGILDQRTADIIRTLVSDATGTIPAKGVEPWPGAPIGHIPLAFTDTLNAMVDSGELVTVERPRMTNPDRMAVFVAFAQKQPEGSKP